MRPRDPSRGRRTGLGRIGSRYATRAGAWALALLAGLLPLPLRAQEAGPPRAEVVDLRFEGETLFHHALLRAAIVTQESGCSLPVPISFVTCTLGFGRVHHEFDAARLREDEVRLRIFYFQRGYREAVVETDTVRRKDGYEVVFRIDPGTPIRVASLEIAGAEEILPQDFGEHLPLRTGRPFNLLEYDAARDSIISAMRNHGYARADVLAGYDIPADSYEARVRFEVIPGTLARFGEIEVEGNRRVSDAVVRRFLTFRTGDLFRQSELLRSQSNLFGMDVFRHASVRARPDAGSDSVIPVTVQVNEGDIHRVRIGTGVNEADCVNAEGRWISRNFLGGARRLEVRGAISNVFARNLGGNFPCGEAAADTLYGRLTGSLSADFAQPWFFGPRNTLGVGLFVERRSVPTVFVRTARGGYLSFTRNLSSRTSASLSYRPELTRLDAEGDIFFCQSFVVCKEEDIEVLSQPHWLAPLNLSFSRDRSNDFFSPTRGYVLRLEAEEAARFLGSDFSYLRLIADLSTYRPLADGVVLATHLRSGWAKPHNGAKESSFGLNPQRRFFAGGPNSVRGYAQYRLGPQVLKVDGNRLTLPVDSGGAGCAIAEVNAGTCDAGVLLARGNDGFEQRPVGGEALLEGSVELRFPLYGDKWRGAAFVDFGQVWAAGDRVRLDEIAITPGIGIRYNSPIGPIRVDVGYNGQGGDWLPVITDELDPTDGRKTGDLLPLAKNVRWNPGGSFFDRLQFHFSIGQAF